MPPRSDDDADLLPAPLGPDRRLWVGLALGFTTILLLATAIHWLVPAAPVSPGGAKGSLNGTVPLMSQPQLLENQQAMPELREFDPQNPPPTPNTGSPLGTPSPPSALGTGVLGR